MNGRNRAALRRGFQVYQTVCAACHGLRLVAYRNLTEVREPLLVWLASRA